MTMVSTALTPVKGFSEFFDTATSTMNPHNRGSGFYVYGTLPVFIVRYMAEWMSAVSRGASDNIWPTTIGFLRRFQILARLFCCT